MPDVRETTIEPPRRKGLRQYLRVLGPGFITGAAGDDPSGVGTYAQVGAQNGTGLLWLLLLATPMLQVVQVTCGKLGIVNRKGLSGILKERYGLRTAAFAAILVTIANVASIGADIAGISAAFALIFGGSWQWYVAPITVAIWYFQVYQGYDAIRKVLLALSLTLLAYVVAGFLAKPEWAGVLRDTFVPQIRLEMAFFATAVGLLGTTISPYMYYFQAAQEVAEDRPVKKVDDMVADTTVGSFFTNFVAYFIIVATAAALHANGIHDVETADQAARALEPFAGPAAKYVFAAGIIGAGLLAIPVLAASTAGMIGEVLGWRIGMHRSVTRARGFYGALTFTLLFALAVALSGVQPMKALFWSQVITGLVAPVLIFLIFRLAGSREVLGDHVNSWKQQAWGWATFGIMVLSASLFLWSLLKGG